jgi:hypothetical protein
LPFPMRALGDDVESESRADVVSSFTIIKGSLIDETYRAFQHWDFNRAVDDNLRTLKDSNLVGAGSVNWLRDLAKVVHRRFDPDARDRPLVELAQAGFDREKWKPLLLWHMTRDEFLVRDFLTNWLYPQYADGVYRVRAEDVVPYLEQIQAEGRGTSKEWTKPTTARVASGLLRMAVDFGLMKGTAAREFVSYHLPEESFLYLVRAMAEGDTGARRIVHSPDWRMFLMDADDVERELLRLHQFRKLDYQVAGSIAQLKLSSASIAEYARELCA